jgi:hypothetical protein
VSEKEVDRCGRKDEKRGEEGYEERREGEVR